MKKVLLLIFILTIWFSQAASAQKIHFTDTSNHWNELVPVWNDLQPPLLYYYTYSFRRDSTIDSNNYRIFDFGFVREDTILRKVYIRDLIVDSDRILMDYNLNAGDTFITPYKKFPVLRIDSTLINTVWHKVWYFQWDRHGFYAYSDTVIVIEGIGCIQHPTFMITDFRSCVECLEPSMYCFSNKGITPPLSSTVSFFNNTSSCAYYPHLLANDLNQEHNNFEISPNPTTSSLTIISQTKITNITIVNLIGQTIYTHNYNTEKIQVNVADLPVGVYFIRINNTEVRKFVKQ